MNCVAVCPLSGNVFVGVGATILSFSFPFDTQPKSSLVGHSSLVLSLAVSADGSRLLSGSADEEARWWVDLRSPGGSASVVLRGHVGFVHCVSVSGVGEDVLGATASEDRTLRLWDLTADRGVCLAVLPVLHSKAIVSCAVRHTRASFMALTASPDGTLRVWGHSGPHFPSAPVAITAPPSAGPRVLSLSPDGTVAAVGCYDGALVMVDPAALTILWADATYASSIFALAHSPCGTRLAVGRGDGSVGLWSATTGRAIAFLGMHTARVFAVCFSANGGTVISGGSDCTLKRWRVNPKQQMALSALISTFVQDQACEIDLARELAARVRPKF